MGMHQPLNPRLELSAEEWEDLCQECGSWEWIDGEVDGEIGRGKGDRNEFGGREFFHPLFSPKISLECHLKGGPEAENKNSEAPRVSAEDVGGVLREHI